MRFGGISDNSSGFETIILDNSAADGAYFPLIIYEDGSSAVNFTISLNSTTFNGELSDLFTAADVGFAVLFPSVTKTGSTFSRVATSGAISTSKYRMDASKFNYLKSSQ